MFRVSIYGFKLIRKFDLDERTFRQTDSNDFEPFSLSFSSLSEFKKAIIPYIAGSAAKMTSKSCICETCCKALGSKYHISSSLFIDTNNHGGLFKPTMSVIKICKQTEKKNSALNDFLRG